MNKYESTHKERVMQIYHRDTGDIIIERKSPSIKTLVEYAVKHGISLSGADLAGENLSNADLSGGDFSYADLTHCNLLNTNFSGANCVSTDFSCAVLAGAKLTKTRLRDAQFIGTWVISLSIGGFLVVFHPSSAYPDDGTLLQIGDKEGSLSWWLDNYETAMRYYKSWPSYKFIKQYIHLLTNTHQTSSN